MKAIVCVLLMAAVAYGAEEKKNEKRGLLGLGYGLSSAPLISHGVGLDYGYGGHGLGVGLGYGLAGHGLGVGLAGHGLSLGHGIVSSAPVISQSVYSSPVYSHGLGYGAPLLGLGHGYIH